MSDGVYAALSGAIAQEAALEHTAQNLANASTGGFRGAHPVFHEVLARTTAGGPPLHFTAVAGAQLDMTPGEVEETGRPLDVALAPRDFLAVRTPAGERYTRAGALRLGADGTLSAPGGVPVLGEDGQPVRVSPGAAVTLGPNGTVYADGAAAGRLRVVTFAQPEAMTLEGGALLSAGGAGAPTPSAQPLHVGALEGSNASPIRGMTDMLQATRMFDAFQRAMETFHDTDRQALTVMQQT
jgi:flagellar basal-body rod protein FlgF